MNKPEKEETKEGWICPKCKKVWAPSVKSCDCTTKENQTPDTKQLLLE